MKDIKKYLIGFIVGLSIVIATSYAANTGSIGALFTNIQGIGWVLPGSNIENGTISKTKLDSGVQSEINANTVKVGITPTQSGAILANTAKVGITPAQSGAIVANTADIAINAANIASNTTALQNKTKTVTTCTAANVGLKNSGGLVCKKHYITKYLQGLNTETPTTPYTSSDTQPWTSSIYPGVTSYIVSTSAYKGFFSLSYSYYNSAGTYIGERQATYAWGTEWGGGYAFQ